MYKYRTAAFCFLLVLSCAFLTVGCTSKRREKIDLSDVQTTAASETMAEPESSAPETEGSSAAPEEKETKGTAGSSVSKISAKINTYSSGKVSIQYPSVINLDDSDQTAEIDALLKDNALSILDAWDVNDAEDSLTITCQVLAADRSRITVVYTGTAAAKGAAHPTNLLYSNTVDVGEISDITFSDLADPYTMAAYVRSDDCTFADVSDELKAELMKAKNDLTLEQYTSLFRNADFPIKSGNGSKGSLSSAFGFPGSFSYEHEGTIFFTIPVSHALGDYAVVAYTPETK